jgi:hypothetical protein
VSDKALGIAYNIAKRNSGKQYSAPVDQEPEVDHRAEYERLMKEAEEHYQHFAGEEPEDAEEPGEEPAGDPAPGQDRKSMIASILAKKRAAPAE